MVFVTDSVQPLRQIPTKEACEGFGYFEIGPVICTVKYSGGLVLLVEGETMLQGVIDRLIEVGI